MAEIDSTRPINMDFFICGWAWQRDLLAVKRAILDAEPVEAIRLLDNLVARLEPEPASYRAGILNNPHGVDIVLTSHEHADLPDDELLALALAEAEKGDIISDEPPRISKAECAERLYIGEWAG